MTSEYCIFCEGTGWVCEAHRMKSWPEGCDCAPGMQCECNPEALLPPDSEITCSVRHTPNEDETP